MNRIWRALLVGLGVWCAGCDVAQPPPARLVVEAFVETERSLPLVTVRRTATLDSPDGAPPVTDAAVTIDVGRDAVPFAAVVEEPGRYAPAVTRTTRSGETFTLTVTRDGQRATASSRLPPAIALDSVRVEVEPPIEAVLTDSLGTEVYGGAAYPVLVTLFWRAPEADSGWVRVRLRPPSFPAQVSDFAAFTDEIRQEAAFDTGDGTSGRTWSGTYAVPVPSVEAPLPPHTLDVSVVRSGEDYARFVLSRSEPGAREPDGNVEGGVGIAVGVALDRRTLQVGE